MIISISKGDPTYDAFVSSGLVAAVNPCGFVLLPTYLMFFLGADTSEAASGLGVRRASIRRALTVSSALTAGFMTVFIVVGIVTYNFTSWIQQNARYATIVIAVGLIGLGIAMLSGRSVGLALPRLDVGGRDRGVRSMFLFGVAYAVASLGCTIGLFLPTLIAVRNDGFVGAIGNVAAYAAGMGLLITALTVSLAVAKIGLLGVLRRGMHRGSRLLADSFCCQVFISRITSGWLTSITKATRSRLPSRTFSAGSSPVSTTTGNLSPSFLEASLLSPECMCEVVEMHGRKLMSSRGVDLGRNFVSEVRSSYG